MRRVYSSLVLVALAGLAAGCGSSLAQVSGTVTLDGQPLDHGRITFQADDRAMAVGEIRSNGAYFASTGSQRGLAPGTYRVTVTAYKKSTAPNAEGAPIAELLTPAKYNRLESSGLVAEIVAGRNTCNFSLSSHSAP